MQEMHKLNVESKDYITKKEVDSSLKEIHDTQTASQSTVPATQGEGASPIGLSLQHH